MERTHGGTRYASVVIESGEEGFIGSELTCDDDGMKKTVARVVFWDSDGQFSVETMKEVPLVILEELIAEAKNLIHG